MISNSVITSRLQLLLLEITQYYVLNFLYLFSYGFNVGSQIMYQQYQQFKITIIHKDTNIYMENSFFLKEKIMGQTLNNFTIIKLITIIYVYVSWLKKKISLVFYTLTHTNYLSQRQQHFALSSLYSSSRIALSLLAISFL